MSASGAIERAPLDGAWSIALDPRDQGRDDRWFLAVPAIELQQTTVPGTIQQTFPSQYGLAWYWRSFSREGPVATCERALLRFHAVEYLAEVWLNGQHLGSHEGGETPFTLDATASTACVSWNMSGAIRPLIDYCSI
jgi:beta-galactosidase/beta-glucuronidase